MSNVVQEHIDAYQERIRALYSEVQRWIEPLSTEVEDVQVLEQASGPYPAPCLIIKSDESEIVRLEPIGTWIIGAEGRVDLIGSNDKTAIVYLKQGGPIMAFRESEGGKEISRSSVPLFQGADQDGWYWIEDKRRGRAKLITRELFRDLVSEVSDYEFR